MIKKTNEEFYLKINLSFFADKSDKTEEATSKRKEKAREEGQVAKSQEIGTAFLFIAVFSALRAFANGMYNEIKDLLVYNLNLTTEIDDIFTVKYFSSYITFILLQIFKIVAPVFFVSMAVGVISNLIQVGWKPTTKPLKPKFSKLNPLSGIKKMLSPNQLIELVKSLFKMVLIFAAINSIITKEIDNIIKIIDMEILQVIVYIGNLVVDMGVTIGMMFLFIAGADFAYQIFKHRKEIRMSKQEIKDEYKEAEGNPQLKGAIKQKMREASMRRMMSDLKTADVIITNPTHFAVALRYNIEKDEAPIVVAKGADLLAKRIRETAALNKIRIVENKPLARSLYASCKVGGHIPQELYQAVAEILAFIYKMNNVV